MHRTSLKPSGSRVLSAGFLLVLWSLASTGEAQVSFGVPNDAAVPRAVANTRDIALGDVDGDGDLDALVVGGHTALWLQRDSGRFVVAEGALPALPGGVPASSIVLEDLDGDGDLDAIAGFADHAAGAFVAGNNLWLNDGNGTFLDASWSLPTPTFGNFGIFMTTGDFDGDGDLDVFGQSLDKFLWINDGSGHFADATAQLPTLLPRVGDVGVADVDGDGDLDLLLGIAEWSVGTGNIISPPPSPNPTKPALWLNDGQGVFTDASNQLPNQLAYVESLVMGDVDGDGDVDAILANGFPGGPHPSLALSGQDLLWLNDGNGNFTDAPSRLPPGIEYTSSVQLADMNGDGTLDFLRGSDASGGTQPLWLNDGTGCFLTPFSSLKLTSRHATLRPADLDRDGDTDLLVGTGGSYPVPTGGGNDELWINSGTDLVNLVAQAAALPGGAVAVGDLDGDGDQDALFADRIRRNRGDGEFEDVFGTLPLPIAAANAIAPFDFDGDGDFDAVVGRSGQTELWVNQGAGTFVDITFILPSDADLTTAIVVRDFDGNGHDDLFLANHGAQNRLWLNTGFNTFVDGTTLLPQIVDFTRSASTGDVDLDGDLDLLIGNDSGADELWLNDGAGGFTDASNQIPQFPESTLSVVLGDVDGDGDLDAVLGSGALGSSGWTSAHLHPVFWAPVFPPRLWTNDGTGQFADASASLPSALGWPVPRSLVLEDMDEDGDLDIVFGGPPQNAGYDNWNEQSTVLWSNDGTGTFADASGSLAPIGVMPFGFAVLDLDDDGDVDILSGGQIQKNLRRQLARPMLPRIGYSLDLDVYGPPNKPYFLAAALGQTYIPLGFQGTMLLDPISAVFLGGALLDATGTASLEIPVPLNPALIGFSVYWQGAVGGNPRTTNLAITTFSQL